MKARLQHIRGRLAFVWLDRNGDGYPVLDTSRAYRPAIYRNPNDPNQAADTLPREWVRMAARNLISTGSQG
jgi:hypothetical protein